MSTNAANARLQVGWASADITPEKPVELAGQFHVRVSEGVLDPVTATALALSSGATAAILVSCDLVGIPDSLRTAVRTRAAARAPNLDPRAIILNGTHTHTAPDIRLPSDFKANGGGMESMSMGVELPTMPQEEYVDFAAERIAGAVVAAWRGRAPGTVGYGLGQAVVGRNRRSCYAGGESRMYGNTAAPDFSHIEGWEDHGVNLLATWDDTGELTGLVVNVACPSQATETLFEVSADYWHDTREELHRRFGAGVFVLPQCSAAGDQSPHVQVGKAAEQRMWRLAGKTQRQVIAGRIADAVSATLPLIEQERSEAPILRRCCETLQLTRRRLTQTDVDEALAEAAEARARYEELQREFAAHPEKRDEPRWYVEITSRYRRMKWCEGVATRFELERTQPRIASEAQVIRLGDVAFATNAFEYYLDFGTRIKARSPAIQTFVVQLAGSGTYVPTARAVAGKSYGAIPASTPVGPEGGHELVEWTVAALAQLWDNEA